jgi:hypothetical protein
MNRVIHQCNRMLKYSIKGLYGEMFYSSQSRSESYTKSWCQISWLCALFSHFGTSRSSSFNSCFVFERSRVQISSQRPCIIFLRFSWFSQANVRMVLPVYYWLIILIWVAESVVSPGIRINIFMRSTSFIRMNRHMGFVVGKKTPGWLYQFISCRFHSTRTSETGTSHRIWSVYRLWQQAHYDSLHVQLRFDLWRGM